jgi:hypothetical protein
MTSTHVWLVAVRRTLPLALAALAVTTGLPLSSAVEGRAVSTRSAIVSSGFAFAPSTFRAARAPLPAD